MKYCRLSLFLVWVMIFSGIVGAQDLGSSSDLFRPANSSVKKSNPKKTAPRKRRAAARRKSTRSKRSTGGRSTASTKITPESESSEKKMPETRILITKATVNRDKPTMIGTNKVIVYGGSSEGNYLEKFENALEVGNTARNQRNYSKAESAYKLARQIDPDDSRAIYGLGNIYSDQQRWEEAERAYRKAIILEPDSAAPYTAISFVLTQPVVGTNLGERYSEAEKMSRIAVRIAPDNALAFDQLGVAMELKGLISKETQDIYRKAIEIDPTFALAYAHLGRILYRNGLTEESSAAYRKSVELAGDAPTMILVADVLQSQQKYYESEQLLINAVRQDPRNPTGLYLLGKALTIRESFAEAEEALKKSVDVSPNSFVSYALLGSLYLRQGQLKKAERALDAAQKVSSDNEKKRLAQEFEEVGDGFMKENSRRDAIRLYLKALSLDEKNKPLATKLSQTRTG